VEAPLTGVRAVLFDFYGTLAAAEWDEWFVETVLRERGYRLDPEADRRWTADVYDGHEHLEESQSEERYASWIRTRTRGLLRDCGVPDEELDAVVAAMDEGRARFRMKPYPETIAVLEELKARGLLVVVCSNWDWDLDDHLRHTGILPLLDGRVSSAWVGARKPHPRIFRESLATVGVDAVDALFVGDNWRADVEGPLAAGMRPVHVWRHREHPGDWLPKPPPDSGDVLRVADLTELLG
jgi:putative hydrolase of the HAD superfamily